MSTPDSGNPGYSLGIGIPYVKYIAPEFQLWSAAMRFGSKIREFHFR
jgi:hypothetical protein